MSVKQKSPHSPIYDYARLTLGRTVRKALMQRLLTKSGCSYFAIFYKTALPLSSPKVYLVDNFNFSSRLIYDRQKLWALEPILNASGAEEIIHWQSGTLPAETGVLGLMGKHVLEAATFLYAMHSGSMTLLTLIWTEPSSRPDLNELYDALFPESRLATRHIRDLSRPVCPVIPGGLSVREIKILRLLADGLTSEQVADAVHVTRATIYFHVKQIMKKTDSTTRSQAITKAALLNLI